MFKIRYILKIENIKTILKKIKMFTVNNIDTAVKSNIFEFLKKHKIV